MTKQEPIILLVVGAAIALVVGLPILRADLEKTPEISAVTDVRPVKLDPAKASTLSINGAVVKLEIVDTPEKMSLGLGGRAGLPEGQGMWFVLPAEDMTGFWMKDMKFSIDILWLDGELKVTGIQHSLSPDTYPEVFYPEFPSRYVLEVPAGFAATNGITLGSNAKILSVVSGN